MAAACYPLSILPGSSRLFEDFVAGNTSGFYPVAPTGDGWMQHAPPQPAHAATLADLLEAQNHAMHAGPAAIANIARLRTGARAVVTGQQVGLFGGPLYTLYKAAAAIRLARDASQATNIEHVPIFWLATEDHDFAEIDHVKLPDGSGRLETVRLAEHADRQSGAPVGALRLGSSVAAALAQARRLLDDGPELELLSRCYRPEATFAGAFAQWLAATFREQGLIVFDAAGRPAHALGARVLRSAITDAAELERLLLERGEALEKAGFHTQVLVKAGAGLLFLLSGDAENEAHTRLPLKREKDGRWKAGRLSYSTLELLQLLDREPERLSPNALLRPVFQDAILPTAAYIGGPAEVAYFAQTAVLHQAILGRQTPILPRLSATLLGPRESLALDREAIDLAEIFHVSPEEMCQKAAARRLPLEGKRKVQAAGAAMTDELAALTEWMRSLNEDLGRSANVAASKMRYQMNRLRRMAARWELEQDQSIRRRIEDLYKAVYPEGHLQERSVGAVWALARYGSALPKLLVEAAGGKCPGHRVITPGKL